MVTVLYFYIKVVCAFIFSIDTIPKLSKYVNLFFKQKMKGHILIGLPDDVYSQI